MNAMSPSPRTSHWIDDNDELDDWPDDHPNDFFQTANQDAAGFPGQDEDMDGVSDDDIDNDGVIDVRENDEKPDLIYDRDLERAAQFTDQHLVTGHAGQADQ